MKLWMPVLIAAAAVGCQAQQKPPAQATSPSVLDVTAPPANYQPTAYAVPAYSASPAGTAYVPPQAGMDYVAPMSGPAYVPPVQAAPAITRTPAVRPTRASRGRSSYTVKRGDTLYRIARQHYGDGKKWRQIAAANPGVTPASLKAGQKLVMP